MPIFDDVVRSRHDLATHKEDEFSFLNRSARPAAARVRNLIGTWVSHYPSDDFAQLRARLRSEFKSTFFELFLHELLLSLGCRVATHPEVETGASRPDFRARFPFGDEVIVEAVVASDQSRDEEVQEARRATLYDEINKVFSPDFSLLIDRITDIGARQPSARKLRRFVAQSISDLDPDHISRLLENHGSDSRPTWTFRDGDFEFGFSVCPKAPAARGKRDSKLIGAYPGEARWGGSAGALKTVLAKKATKYGALGYPYVIAVNAIGQWGTNRRDEAEALFGSDEAHSALSIEELRRTRGRNGLWIGPQGIRNTRVSAVLFARVGPWGLPGAPIRLYHNPFAQHPCVDSPWRIPQAVPDGSTMSWIDGATVGELLGLDPHWPGQLFDD